MKTTMTINKTQIFRVAQILVSCQKIRNTPGNNTNPFKQKIIQADPLTHNADRTLKIQFVSSKGPLNDPIRII